MMDEEVLKYEGYRPKLMYILVILTILVRHLSSLMMALKYLYKI